MSECTCKVNCECDSFCNCWAAFIEQCPLCKAAPQLLAACKAAREAMGAHGPCRNNSCRECKRAWKLITEALAAAAAAAGTAEEAR